MNGPINPGSFKPTKKLPAPFQRPSITVGGGIQKKREWKYVNVEELDEGDVVVDLGLVHEITYENIDTPENLVVALLVGEHEIPIKFEAGTLLKAFA